MTINERALQQLNQGGNEDLEHFAEALLAYSKGKKSSPIVARGYKNNPTTVGGVTPYLHGGGGLFSPFGQSRGVLSAMLEVGESAVNYFPVVEQTQLWNEGGMDTPYLTFVTGVTEGDLEDWDNQPSAACDDAPVGGLMKACTITFPYGRLFQSLRQVNALDVNRRVNRGEFDDLQLINTPNQPTDPFRAQGTMPNSAVIQRELDNRFYEMGVSFSRLVSPLAYTGNPTNNKGTDGARQWIGLDRLINTNFWTDAFTANVCTALDSIIYNFQNTDITAADPNGYHLYTILQSMFRNFRSNADRMGLNPATWVLVMNDDLFYELTRVINIQEYIRMIEQIQIMNQSGIDGGQIHLSGVDQRKFNDEMYNNRFIPIDGIPVKVVKDYAIRPTSVGGGAFRSSIYFVNETATGQQMTYWDFNKFQNPAYTQLFERMFNGSVYATDGGRFLWAKSYKNYCATLEAVCEPRLMHHTPMLSGRITNINYTPVMATRSPFPASDGSFYDGGRTNAPLPRVYNNGNATTPSYPGINLQ